MTCLANDSALKPLTSEEMRKVEDECESMGVSRLMLMENAGAAVARYITARLRRLTGVRIMVVAGTGNNGGDGFVSARHLAGSGARVHVLLLGRGVDIRSGEALSNWLIVKKMTSSLVAEEVAGEGNIRLAEEALLGSDVIVDAIFGTGVRDVIRQPHSYAIDLINRSGAFKVAVDLPSGLNPDSGEIHDKCVRADVTVTLHKVKRGLLVRKDMCGRVRVAAIGIPPEAEEKVLGAQRSS